MILTLTLPSPIKGEEKTENVTVFYNLSHYLPHDASSKRYG